MFHTPIVEVAIGLFFVFSLLAILVTQINTLISNVLKLRAKQLKAGLQQLIIDEKLQAELLIHPLINMVKQPMMMLSLRLNAQIAQEVNAQKAELNNVNYIAPSTFVEALLSILISRSGGDLYQSLRVTIEDIEDPAAKTQLLDLLQRLQDNISAARLHRLEQAIQQQPNNQHLLAAFLPIKQTLELTRYPSPALLPLLSGVAKIDTPPFREAIRIILTTARDLDDARQKLENWFNDGMDRASELYRRQLQFMSLVVALVVALVFNVDTLHLGRALWEDPALRQNVAEIARAYEQASIPPAPLDTLPPAAGFTETQAPIDENAAPDANDDQALTDAIRENVDDIGITVQKLLELQLPIGWQYVEVTDDMINLSQELGLPDPRNNGRNFWNLTQGNFGLIIQKLLGILATTIAAAQGAPFWFDLLNRITRRNG